MKISGLKTTRAKVIAAFTALAVLGAAVFLIVRAQQAGRPEVQLAPVTQAGIRQSVVAVGDIEARNRHVITLSPAVKVVEVRVSEGQRVDAGDVLAVLDTSEFRSQLEQQGISLDDAQSTLQYLAGPNAANNEASAQNAVAQAQVALDGARAAEAAARQHLANLPGFSSNAMQQAGLAVDAARLNAEAAWRNVESVRRLNADAVCQAQLAVDAARLAHDNAVRDLEALDAKLASGQITQAEYDAQYPALSFAVDNAHNALRSAKVSLDTAKVTADANVRLAEKTAEDADLAVANAEAARDSVALRSDADRQSAEQAVSDAQRAINSAQIALSSAQNAAAAARAGDSQRITSQSSQIALLDANVRHLLEKVDQGQLRATVAGVVSRMDAVANQYPQLGDAIVVEGSYGYVASVGIAQADSAGLRAGLGAKVTLKGLGTSFKGTVTSVAPVAATSPTSADQHPKVSVEVAIVNPDDTIRVGFEADVEVVLEDKSEALQVSTAAVRTDPASGRAHVWVVDDKNRVAKVQIETGIHADSQVEVVSGLAKGQYCVLDPDDTLTDGQPVRVAGGRR